MVALAILLLLVILFILLSFKGSTSRKLEHLEQEIMLLRKQVSQPPAATVTTISTAEEKPEPPVIQPEQSEEWTSGFKVVTDSTAAFKKEDWLPKEDPVKKPEPAVAYSTSEQQPLKETRIG